MAYKYEDTDYWVEQILPIQRQVKPFVTVEQCRRAWKLSGKSAAHRRLDELVSRGKAERVLIGGRWHYHILDENNE